MKLSTPLASMALLLVSIYTNGQNCNPGSIPIYINNNITWGGTNKLTTDVEILNGGTLTLTGRLEMLELNRVIIHPGGKMIIDGGTATRTDSCSTTWMGIEVRGQSGLPQTPANQGVLEIKNQGTISYASSGFGNATRNNNKFNWQETGGIIHANNANFINNTRDAWFISYCSLDSNNQEKNYEASFINCNFIRDNSFDSDVMLPQITMLEVSGVKFEGCEFICTNTDTLWEHATDAIFTIKANYIIKESNTRNSLFSGYRKAIMSTNAARADKVIDIQNTDFEENTYGVNLVGCANFVFRNNQLNTPWRSSIDPNDGYTIYSYGLFLDASYNFEITENDFFYKDSSGNIVPETGGRGLVVRDGGVHLNRIYKNTFEGLKTACTAFNHNRNANGTDGLIIKCNDFANNFPDVWVYKGIYGLQTPSNEMGIAKNQGIWDIRNLDGKGLANNLFSRNTKGNSLADYRIEPNNCEQSNYTYSNNSLRNEPKDAIGLNLNAIPVAFSYSSFCPSPPSAAGLNETTLLSDLGLADADFAQSSAQLSSLLDGGNTAQLEAQILISSNLADYQNLYIDLMSLSPYVSEENLLNLLELPNFPEMALRNILVANPHSATTNAIMEAVYTYSPALSTQTINDIENGALSFTTKDVLEAQISQANIDRHTAVSRLLQYYRESSGNEQNEITTLLDQRSESHYQYMMLDMEIHKGDLSAATARLQDLSTGPALQESERVLFDDYLEEYYQLQIDVIEDKRNLSELTEAEISKLQNLLDHNSGIARANIQSLLWQNGITSHYFEPEGIDYAFTQKRESDMRNRPDVRPNFIKLYPNPASAHSFLQWNWLSLGLTEAIEVEVYNNNGQIIQSLTMSDYRANIATLDTKNWLAGLYFIEVKSGGVVLLKEKLLINH